MNRLSFVAGAVAAFIVSAASWSVLQSAPVAPAAADQTLGMAQMFAVVAADGTLVRGSGVLEAGAAGGSDYRLVFNRSIASCAYFMSIVSTVSDVFAPPGMAGAATITELPSTLFVSTRDAAGAASDRPFHVLVYCTR
jgi:hypothetical protein